MIRSGLSAFLKNPKIFSKDILITVPSDIKYIKKVSSKILEKVSSYCKDSDILFDIKLCVEEAVRNAMVHGNLSDKRKKVSALLRVDHGKAFIEITDEGRGFDHKKVPDPTEADNMLRNSGRGVYLIKNLMDSVEYKGSGNKLVMMKRLKQ